MPKYLLQGKLNARPGNRDALIDILLLAAERVGTLEGSLLYTISTEDADPNAVYVTEIWDSKSAHDDSLKDPQVLALIADALPLIDGRPEKGLELKLLGGAGLSR